MSCLTGSLPILMENIYLPLTIPEICEHIFAVADGVAADVQEFHRPVPEKVHHDKKLERSYQMLLENRYTISEISLRLGYTSIH